MLVMVSVALPVLLRVTGCDALVVPTSWLPKDGRLRGETLATGVTAVMKLATRFETLTVPIPVAKSHPVVVPNVG
jgi:hypothetical protein